METLNSRAFEEIVENEGKACLVIFSRKTCSVCQEVHTILEDIMQDYKDSGFGFYNVDVEEEEELFRRFHLKGVPQVMLFDGGNLKTCLSGLQDEDAYIDEINKYVD